MTALHRAQDPRVAVVRGEALNPFEMQVYSLVAERLDLFAVGRRDPLYDLDTIRFRYRLLPALNQYPTVRRLARVAAWHRFRLPHPDRLFCLGWATRDRTILHAAEIAFPLTQQVLEIANKTSAHVILTCWENIPFRGDEDPTVAAMKRRAVISADHFIATSQSARGALIDEGVEPERISVIPPGIDCERFEPDGPRAPVRETLGLSSDVLLALFVGRVIGEKGVVELVRALASLENPRVHLAIMGDGAQKPRVQRAARLLGVADRVHLLEHTAYGNLPTFLRAADLIAVPSLSTPYWQEQFGMILAESMACGLPILATRSGAIPEVVGDAAVLVPDYDVEALATGLEKLVEDENLRHRLALLGRKRAVEKFAIDVVAPQIEQCYRAVTSRPPRAEAT